MSVAEYTIRRYVRDGGIYRPLDRTPLDIDHDFGFIRCKSVSGLNSRGKQSSVYSESYAGSSSSRVYVSPSPCNASVTATLTVYSFGSDPSEGITLSDSELSARCGSAWRSFVDKLEGCLFMLSVPRRDSKGLFYLLDAIEPTTDIVKGVPYLECPIKLQNVFGRTFSIEDTTIESWLDAGGSSSNTNTL